MAIPAQVKKQSEAVQKLYDELNADTAVQDTSEAEGEIVEAEVVKTADSESKQAVSSSSKEQKQDGTKNDDESVAQKYKTLQGMYNAEVPRLHAERRELSNRVAQLEQLIATMNSQPAQRAPTAPTQSLITDADKEEWGDSLEVMRKVSREENGAYQARIDQLEQMIRQMQSSVVPQVQQISQRQALSAEQGFWGELQQAVPDWQEINASPEFQSWLLETDPLTGISRQTYLDDAQRNLDARRVVNFFTTWKTLTGQSVAQQPNRRAAASSELEKQVAPGRSRSTGGQASGEPKTYTSEDIKKFFADVQKGRYKGKEQERDRIERDIFAAQREGRIVNA